MRDPYLLVACFDPRDAICSRCAYSRYTLPRDAFAFPLIYKVCGLPCDVPCPIYLSRDFASYFSPKKLRQVPRHGKPIPLALFGTLDPLVLSGGKSIFHIASLSTWDYVDLYASPNKTPLSVLTSKLYLEPVSLIESKRHFLSKALHLNRGTLGC